MILHPCLKFCECKVLLRFIITHIRVVAGNQPPSLNNKPGSRRARPSLAVPVETRVGLGRKALAFHAKGLEDQLAHAGRVGLSAGDLHDATNNGTNGLDLAATDLIRNVRLGC